MKNKTWFVKKLRGLNSKRGVSPLIATVLLIAFAVALGAVVMNWGRSYVEETASFAKTKSNTEVRCSMDVRIKEVKINDVTKFCYNDTGGFVNFLIKNSGRKQITRLLVQVINTNDNVNTTTLNVSIPVGYNYHGVVNYTGSFQQVEVIPNILVSGEYIPCTDAALTFDSSEITECS